MKRMLFLSTLVLLILPTSSSAQGVKRLPTKQAVPTKQASPKAKVVQTKLAKKNGSKSQKAAGKAGVSTKGGKSTKAAKIVAEKAKNKKDSADVTLNIETKDASKNGDIPIPEGATEEDIRVIRNANKMRVAEKKLGEIMKRLKIKGNAIRVPFAELDSWTYEEGYTGMPKDLKKYNGKRVVMVGFMFPIYEVENIKTFYLVKSLWSCCYGQPPDINGLVRVEVKKKGGIAYQYDPIIVVGTFRLKKTMDEDYCTDIFTLDSDSVRVLDLDIK